MGNIIYQQCPCCGSNHIAEALTVKDYTVSGQTFSVWHCGDCTFRFTQDIPDIQHIGAYYQSANYASHSDTKEGLVNRVYHMVRNYTLQGKRKLVQQTTGLQQGALLDVGAGTGYFANTMQQAGWQVTGLEPDHSARMVAQGKYNLTLQEPGVLYHLEDNRFDAITMWHVLEHVHDLDGYLRKFHKILKPGGKLIIAVPNYTSHDAQVYKAYWAAYDVPRHLYHFSPQSINVLAAAKGFSVKAYKPMWFDSFYVAMLSEQYKNGKGNLLRALWNGLVSNLKTLGNAKNCSSVIYVLAKQ